MTAAQLPNVPSELILLALGDLEKAEASPDYEIDMERWHEPDEGKCLVCLAGSVMAFRLNAPVNRNVIPAHFGAGVKLFALDRFRAGYVAWGLRFMGTRQEFPNRQITRYADDPDQFKADMRKLAADLKEAGL